MNLEPLAIEEAIGDVDTFVDELETLGRTSELNNAERMLRLPHRLQEADKATVLCAALLSAHRGDLEESGRCIAELLRRYKDLRAAWIQTRAGEMERDLEEDEGTAADRRRDDRKHEVEA